MENQPPQQDTLYQTYNRSLYKTTGEETMDNIMDYINADMSVNNSSMVNLPAEAVGSGSSTNTMNMQGGAITSGKQAFGDGTEGYWIGVDTDGNAKINIGNTINYIQWNGTTLSVVGGFNVSSINIPDTTTANSFHVATNGNTWWGSNVATGYTGANAYILDSGQAFFNNITMGGTTIQYVITNSGIFSYGDGSDGAVTISTNTTLTRDMYYTTLTVSSGATLNPNGWRIFCSVSLTITGSTISQNGGNGSNGSNGLSNGVGGAGGGGGAGATSGYLVGSNSGANGGAGAGANGNGGNSTGTSVSDSLGTNGADGGTGGGGTIGSFPAGTGTGGTATAAYVKLIANWHLATLLDITPTGATLKFQNSAGAAGGGGGRQGSGVGGAGGAGGGGGGGGFIAIYARNISIDNTSLTQANGGNGGNGGNGVNNPSGGGGTGGGGNGGIIVLVYNSLVNNGTLSAAGGTAGPTGGTGVGVYAGAASLGSNGSAGSIYTFQLSL